MSSPSTPGDDVDKLFPEGGEPLIGPALRAAIMGDAEPAAPPPFPGGSNSAFRTGAGNHLFDWEVPANAEARAHFITSNAAEEGPVGIMRHTLPPDTPEQEETLADLIGERPAALLAGLPPHSLLDATLAAADEQLVAFRGIRTGIVRQLQQRSTQLGRPGWPPPWLSRPARLLGPGDEQRLREIIDGMRDLDDEFGD